MPLVLREESPAWAMRAAAKVWRKLFYREQWFLLLELPAGDGLTPDQSRCIPLYPPAGCLWADPFIWSTPDAHFVFVEELPFTTGKGHISVLELSREGRLRDIRKVLERPYHLSYPFLFQWNGSLYMIPESGANRTVEVYRCSEFPHSWVFDRLLLQDIVTADATLVEHAGRWWMFVNQLPPSGSIHESLHLYSAPTPLGPFAPHAGNPVKSSLYGSRPAGAMFTHAGHLFRPAQDCSHAYGEAVVIQKVVALTDTRFEEVEAARIVPNGDTPVRRIHTVNSGDGVRVIDALRWIAR